jgi:hypothetical protein
VRDKNSEYLAQETRRQGEGETGGQGEGAKGRKGQRDTEGKAQRAWRIAQQQRAELNIQHPRSNIEVLGLKN